MPDFFGKKTDDTTNTPTTQPETVKLGGKEYTQEELSQLVGLGETAREYEAKWNRPISQFYPDYTQKSQKLADLERQETERARQAEEQKQRELEEKAKMGDQLSPEEARKVAREEATRLGLITDEGFEEKVNKAVANALAAKDLLEDAQVVITEAKEKGQPETTVENLLRHMNETGFRNPEKAYKDMFEPELDKWKEEQLKKIKPAGMETQEGSTAGAKVPPSSPTITRDTLSQAIQESLTRGRGV